MFRNRVLLALTCVAVASCSQAVRSTDVPVERYGECGGAGITKDTCVKVGGITRCHVLVSERAGKAPWVYPYTLSTPGPTIGASAPTTVIVWHLVGGKFRDRADGAILSASSPEFSDATPSSDFDGDVATAASSPHFRMRFLNSTVPPKPYKYTIKFLNSENREVTCDPLIANAGG
jgi:hypothetical protein